jgi:hypothetical protein
MKASSPLKENEQGLKIREEALERELAEAGTNGGVIVPFWKITAGFVFEAYGKGPFTVLNGWEAGSVGDNTYFDYSGISSDYNLEFGVQEAEYHAEWRQLAKDPKATIEELESARKWASFFTNMQLRVVAIEREQAFTMVEIKCQRSDGSIWITDLDSILGMLRRGNAKIIKEA